MVAYNTLSGKIGVELTTVNADSTTKDNMGFKDELEQSTSSNVAGIDRIAATMSESDSKELMEALSEQLPDGEFRYQASKIASLLRSKGHTISDRAVQRYRKEKL